jgi:RNA polymerase sigma-70 factor (ECF subfamily)
MRPSSLAMTTIADRRRGRQAQMSGGRPPSLTSLVVAAQGGSAAAFEELVRELAPLLYRFLVVRLRNEADARDTLQETLIVAWQRLPELRDPQSCRAWLLTIAVRKATELARKRSRDPVAEARSSQAQDMLAALELDAALAALPSEMRDVILLRYLVGLSEVETAEALQVRAGTVKSRASRARRRLAVMLESVEEADHEGDGR